MNPDYRRDPEKILAEITREEKRNKPGRLKIFLGYASGYGKSPEILKKGGAGSRAREKTLALCAGCSRTDRQAGNRGTSPL